MAHTAAIKRIIERHLVPLHFELSNESAKHGSGRHNPAAETHFLLVIVAEKFEELAPIQRHRYVYKLLAQQLAGGVHSLSLHLYTAAEWQQRSGLPQTPPCAKSAD